MPYITKLHLDNFAGNDKIYLKLDRTEEEENFYVYGSNSLLKLPGYHIYFEKILIWTIMCMALMFNHDL